jgi:DNA-binding beta-propeller fold protein YncE
VAPRPSTGRTRPALSAAARRREARRRAVRRRQAVAGLTILILVVIVAVALASGGGSPQQRTGASSRSGAGTGVNSAAGAPAHHGPVNVYAADTPSDLSPVVKGDPALVYVPNSLSNTVDVISQKTFKVVKEFATGGLPQHVTPAWNLKTLYVDNDDGNSLTPINPRTGQPGTPIPVEDPYNMYFTPDGRYAIVVAERLERLDFRNSSTMKLVHSLSVPQCFGIDHADFSANGRYMFASCEFNGRMVEVDLRTQRVIRTLVLNGGHAAPQDVKLSPDGRVVYTADQDAGGLWEIDPVTFRVIGFLHTGAGAHGLYPSRDATDMYVSNRAAGSVSVVSFATRKVLKTWQLPQPASPDMGGVSADGRTLWLSGRYNSVVYAINTQTGRLRAAIPVGAGPHGLCVWPQPGRYSLGHTGIMR